jgi:hypothetical protein
MIHAFYAFLSNQPHESADNHPLTDPITDDDIIMLIDAYDILLLPAIRQVTEQFVLASTTPILFSGEAFNYPEPVLAHAYPKVHHRDKDSNLERDNVFPPMKFLNSGVILGRAKEMKTLLTMAKNMADIYGDDQQIYTRLYIDHPHLISYDITGRYFYSTYRHARLFAEFQWNPLFQCFHPMLHNCSYSKNTNRQGLAVIHANAAASNWVYESFSQTMEKQFKNYLNIFTTDEDRSLLLDIIWTVGQAQYDSAKAILTKILTEKRQRNVQQVELLHNLLEHLQRTSQDCF